MTAHTPGPWVRTRANSFVYVRSRSTSGVSICRMSRERTGAIAGERGPTAAERDANANLVASAPDMLEALELVSEYFARMGPPLGESDETHFERKVRTEIRHALAKADPAKVRA